MEKDGSSRVYGILAFSPEKDHTCLRGLAVLSGSLS